VTHRNPSTHRGAREQRPPHSQETRERLRVLWASGLSSQEIGRRLDMSKNGVVGLAHRMGLPQRPSPIRPANPATPPLPRASRRVAADVVRLASPSAVSGSTARAPVLPARAAANPPPVLAATSPPSQPVTPDRPAAAAPARRHPLLRGAGARPGRVVVHRLPRQGVHQARTGRAARRAPMRLIPSRPVMAEILRDLGQAVGVSLGAIAVAFAVLGLSACVAGL
jgi:DNA-binding CsgD family transcriptional regulator